jgi:hypothetical protein
MGKNRCAISVENKSCGQWQAIKRAEYLKFMEDLIITILQGIFEFLIEIFGYWPVDWILPVDWPKSLIGKCITWFIIGCGLACISMLFLNRTWISHPALRIANLVLAPINFRVYFTGHCAPPPETR